MWFVRRLAVVVLGAYLALSMAVPFAQAAMSQPMRMAMPQMESHEKSPCEACDPAAPVMSTCSIVCGLQSTALAGELTLAAFNSPRALPPLPRAASLNGITSAPIPTPPRTTYIG